MSNSNPVLRSKQDIDVINQVSRFLAQQHYPAFRRFKIEVDDGAVTVTGRVDSYHEKQIAIAACQHVVGVMSLIDQIEVTDR